MGELCGECERLWSEYSSAVREHLGLNNAAPTNSRVLFPSCSCPGSACRLWMSELRKRIADHEYAAHPEGT
jgi:hypothetical protein